MSIHVIELSDVHVCVVRRFLGRLLLHGAGELKQKSSRRIKFRREVP